MANTEAAAVQRRARTGVWILGVLSACLLILAAAVVYAAVREPEVWDPLGEYPPQTVTSRVEGVEGPAAHLDGTVDVEAVKCGPESGGEVRAGVRRAGDGPDDAGVAVHRPARLNVAPRPERVGA